MKNLFFFLITIVTMVITVNAQQKKAEPCIPTITTSDDGATTITVYCDGTTLTVNKETVGNATIFTRTTVDNNGNTIIASERYKNSNFKSWAITVTKADGTDYAEHGNGNNYPGYGHFLNPLNWGVNVGYDSRNGAYVNGNVGIGNNGYGNGYGYGYNNNVRYNNIDVYTPVAVYRVPNDPKVHGVPMYGPVYKVAYGVVRNN